MSQTDSEKGRGGHIGGARASGRVRCGTAKQGLDKRQRRVRWTGGKVPQGKSCGSQDGPKRERFYLADLVLAVVAGGGVAAAWRLAARRRKRMAGEVRASDGRDKLASRGGSVE